jgi:hypothetical protein
MAQAPSLYGVWDVATPAFPFSLSALTFSEKAVDCATVPHIIPTLWNAMINAIYPRFAGQNESVTG